MTPTVRIILMLAAVLGAAVLFWDVYHLGAYAERRRLRTQIRDAKANVERSRRVMRDVYGLAVRVRRTILP